MELTQGILKSVESHFYQNHNNQNKDVFILKYKGLPLYGQHEDKIKFFNSETKAKTYLTSFIKILFCHGEYWNDCKDNVKRYCGYDINYSGTIEILSSTGLVSRFDEPKNKKMFKDIGEQLLKEKIITIEKFKL